MHIWIHLGHDNGAQSMCGIYHDMKIMEWDFLQVPNHLPCKDHTFKAGFGKDRIPFSKC